MHYSLYISLRNKTYLESSLVELGIILQNNESNIVSAEPIPVIPYIRLTEGYIFHPELYTQFYSMSDVEVYSRGKLVFEKKTHARNSVSIINDDLNVFDLHDINDQNTVTAIIKQYEESKDIFLLNSEPIPNCVSDIAIAGLASGTMTARLAYTNKVKKVVFFDYSPQSLSFQKELIQSKDRQLLFQSCLDQFTLGYKKATIEDLEQLPYKDIDTYYDYLRNIDVEFLLIDMRNNIDIEKLFNSLPNSSDVWISNVLNYITTINHYSLERYQLLDKLAIEKNINILPHTRVYYES
jgi:hypothetical protein